MSVTTVQASLASRKAARWASSTLASSQRRNAVPSCTPLAPSMKAAATWRPSDTPPAAITGTRTASTICGSRAKRPACWPMSTPVKVPRWPPASVPWAMIASTPRRSNSLASATVVALQIVKIPAVLMASITSVPGRPKWKLTICGLARRTMARCSRLTSLAAPTGCGTAPRPLAS